MFFDTHAHLDGLGGMAEAHKIIERASDRGVSRILAVGGTPEGNRVAIECARMFPGVIFAAVGLDQECEVLTRSILDEVERLAAMPEVMAIGEIGLDFHYHRKTANVQKAVFGAMLEIALRLGKPVLVHVRESEAEIQPILESYVERRHGCGAYSPGAIHCFIGNISFAQRMTRIGFMISFSGILTFPNANQLRCVARDLPEEVLLLETDSPLLAPALLRGRRNEPANLIHIAQTLAEVRNCAIQEIGEITTRNAMRLLGLQKE